MSFGHSRQLVRQLSIYFFSCLVILVVDENVLKCVCMLNNFGLNCLASSIFSLIGYGPSASAGDVPLSVPQVISVNNRRIW